MYVCYQLNICSTSVNQAREERTLPSGDLPTGHTHPPTDDQPTEYIHPSNGDPPTGHTHPPTGDPPTRHTRLPTEDLLNEHPQPKSLGDYVCVNPTQHVIRFCLSEIFLCIPVMYNLTSFTRTIVNLLV